jgi:hypothetical protein
LQKAKGIKQEPIEQVAAILIDLLYIKEDPEGIKAKEPIKLFNAKKED